MNIRTLRNNQALLEQLAAAYALGTLRGGARRRFEGWLQRDPALQRAVAGWQDRLAPLAELAPAATPPAALWQTLERRLQLAPPSVAPAAAAPSRLDQLWQRWRDKLPFWRGLGIASTALATVLLALLLGRQFAPAPPLNSYIATLADANAQTVAVVSGDARRRQLTVRILGGPPLMANQSLELWAVPKEGTPRSLGLLAANGVVTLPLPTDAAPESTPLLAISLEPKGGSPNPNGPSGPILYKGAWVRM